MRGFLTAWRSELFLHLRSRGLRALLALVAVTVVARVALEKLGAVREKAVGLLQGGSGEDVVAETAYGPFVDGLSAGLTVTYLIVLILAANAVAWDREHGVVRQLLTRRVSRGAWVTAKFVNLTLLGVTFMSLVVLFSGAAAALCYDFGPVLEDGYEIISQEEIPVEIHRPILEGLYAAAVPLPATVAFGLLVSASCRSAVGAVTTALGLTLLFDLFKSFLGDLAAYVYASFPPSLLDTSHLRDVARLVRGYSDVVVDEELLALNFSVPLPQALLFLIITLILVCRRRM